MLAGATSKRCHSTKNAVYHKRYCFMFVASYPPYTRSCPTLQTERRAPKSRTLPGGVKCVGSRRGPLRSHNDQVQRAQEVTQTPLTPGSAAPSHFREPLLSLQTLTRSIRVGVPNGRGKGATQAVFVPARPPADGSNPRLSSRNGAVGLVENPHREPNPQRIEEEEEAEGEVDERGEGVPDGEDAGFAGGAGAGRAVWAVDRTRAAGRSERIVTWSVMMADGGGGAEVVVTVAGVEPVLGMMQDVGSSICRSGSSALGSLS